MQNFEITQVIPFGSNLTIKTNFEEVKAELEQFCEGYKNLIITDDNVKTAKKNAKMLAGMRVAIDDYRKTKKKELEKPIKDFEADCKALISIITETEAPLLSSVEVFDDKRREEKRAEAEKFIAAAVAKAGLNDKYAATILVKDEYLLLSKTKKAVKEDIDTEVNDAKLVQEKEENDKKFLYDLIENENQSLLSKISPDRFIARFENGESLVALSNDIKEMAEGYRKASEEAARREAEEAAKRAEEAAKKTNDSIGLFGALNQEAAGCLTDPNSTKSTTEENAIDEVDKFLAEFTAMVPPVEAPKPVEQIWSISFNVKSEFSKLQKLNQYLKDNGIEYNIVNQVRIK